MALQAHMKLKGQKQGEIKGDCAMKGREKTIEVIAVSHSVISPRDSASGMPTGKRQHKPYQVTIQNGSCVPQLYYALTNNEMVTEWTLHFYRPSPSGAEEQYYTVALANASIASIDFKMANVKHPELTRFTEYLDVAFTYEKITWTIVKPNAVEAMDSWLDPIG
jgi:type VI secretion system secreted protein Hcp